MFALCDEAVHCLEISIVHEKEEEESGRVERPSISDKVSDVDEGRGRATARLFIPH